MVERRITVVRRSDYADLNPTPAAAGWITKAKFSIASER